MINPKRQMCQPNRQILCFKRVGGKIISVFCMRHTVIRNLETSKVGMEPKLNKKLTQQSEQRKIKRH